MLIDHTKLTPQEQSIKLWRKRLFSYPKIAKKKHLTVNEVSRILTVIRQKEERQRTEKVYFYRFLSIRAVNCAKDLGVKKLSKIRSMTDKQFIKGVRNCGRKTVDELRIVAGSME